MVSVLGLLRRGLERPEKIPRYLFGLLHPSSRWGPEWRRLEGVVRFEPGGYAASARNRPEFASNLYHEVSGLRAILETHLERRPRSNSLEIGCGYGRLSPWIAEYTDDHYGLDPDGHALALAAEQYPRLEFVLGRAGSLPFPDDEFDLIVTWTVLQHVGEETIGDALSEIGRVLAPGGVVVCCERVRPPADDHIVPRSLEAYERAFVPLESIDVRERPVEPTWAESMDTTRPAECVMVFRDDRHC